MNKMYICDECHNVFEQPKDYVENLTPGGGCESRFNYHYTGCPYCEGTYSEAKRCPLCDDTYVPVNDRGQVDYCDNCKSRMEKHFKKVMLDNIDEMEYDYFYEWLECKDYNDFRKED